MRLEAATIKWKTANRIGQAMTRSDEEQAVCDRFAIAYQRNQSAVMGEIERAVCGCHYGGTSWATRSEVDDIQRRLALEPGRHLLEIGAGSGWPGLYLAQNSGCDMTMIDLPLAGLKIAAERTRADAPAGACTAAVADAAALPFENGCFDAISHSDVLCCLESKMTVLAECRRVIRADGLMAFTVIALPDNLTPAEIERGRDVGPPFVESELDYPTMLARTGWQITSQTDMTQALYETRMIRLREDEAHIKQLIELQGERETKERLAKDRATIRAMDDGLRRRDLYVVAALAGP